MDYKLKIYPSQQSALDAVVELLKKRGSEFSPDIISLVANASKMRDVLQQLVAANPGQLPFVESILSAIKN
jgi:hypothetical protein